MLLNDFFYLEKSERNDQQVSASIRINKNHKILEGHFPGLPVVPGVCMLELIKEIMEESLGQKLLLKSAENMKFLSVINPNEQSQVEANITYKMEDDKTIGITASLFSGSTTFFKLKARLQHSM